MKRVGTLQKTGRTVRKREGGDKVLFAIVFVIFLIHSLGLIFPILYLFMNSFKSANEYFDNPLAWPTTFHFDNYAKAFSSFQVGDDNFFTLLLNSIWYVGLTALAEVLAPMAVGYCLARYEFRGKGIMYAVILFSLTIPIVGTGAAGIRLLANLGLYDSPLNKIVNLASGFTAPFLVFYGFFRSVSKEYAEAAEIDGAGPFTTFFRIMVPQAFPIIITFLITGFIAAWNDYESVLLYFPSWNTISSGLFAYKENNARADFPLYYAGLMIAMVPTITIFSIFSKKIMTSISVGGIKG